MDEQQKIVPILQKDLYEDKTTVRIRIPTEDLEHGDKIKISVEKLGSSDNQG